MRKVITHRDSWRSAFDVVIPTFMEIKQSHGHLGAIDYSKALEATGGGASKGIVRVSISDFLCEVEIAARRALTAEEYDFFKTVYVNAAETVPMHPELYKTIDNTVREKVGKMLISREIYPLADYMKSKDVR